MAHFEHTTTEGERWDLIAWDYYRDVSRQSDILAANRHVFVDAATGVIERPPAILPAGFVLRIPILEPTEDRSLLPPWKRNTPAPPPGPGAGDL